MSDKAVISLKEKRKCFHHKIKVDDSLNYVWCGDCNEELNAVWVLSRYAKQENSIMWQQQQNEIRLKFENEELEKRKRTKCKHCGKMTEVNIHISDGKVQEESWNIEAKIRNETT